MSKKIPKQKAMTKMNTSKKRILKKDVVENVVKGEALALSLELAIKAAKFLLKKQKKIETLKITTKVAQGITSEADTESEKIIISGIKKKYPDHFVLAEESAYKKYQGEMSRYNFLKEKEWVWIIDPLDGTNNYLNGLDYFGVCISLCHFGSPVVGVVLRPGTGECFYAIKSKGTKVVNFSENFSQRSRSKIIGAGNSKKKLQDSLLVTGFTTEKGEVFDQEFALFKMMVGKSRGIRRMGSAALDLCYVAKGSFDCFWERGLAAWDVSAAGLICQEAGVNVTDYEGREFHPFQDTILAGRTAIHTEILSLFGNSL